MSASLAKNMSKQLGKRIENDIVISGSTRSQFATASCLAVLRRCLE